MNVIRRLLHRCEPPDHLPVTEDQRFSRCEECGRIWQWAELEDGIGWRRYV